MIELKDASLAVDGKPLLRRLSMMAHQGQLTCITGSRGAGKTLLLRVLMGFVALDEGLVSIDGELLTPLSLPVFRRKMAYVPQLQRVATIGDVPDTSDLETVWGGGTMAWNGRKAVERPVVTIQDKSIVLADDPDPQMLSQLKALTADGRIVIVATCREEYLAAADKIIRLGDNGHFVS